MLSAFMVLVIFFSAAIAAGTKKGGATVTTGPVTMSCPEGFLAEFDHCVRYLEQPLVAVCHEGILQPDNKCLVIVPPTRSCPSDFVLSGHQCIRTGTAPAILNCPPGYNFEPGYKKSASVCTIPVERVTEMCPVPSVRHDGQCLVESRTPATMVCPDGSLLNGKFCVRSDFYDCPSGPKYIHHPKRMLSEGPYKVIEGRRLGPKKLEYNQNLVEVAIIDQKCEKRIMVPPLTQCPPGARIFGQECVITQIVQPIVGPAPLSFDTAPPTATCPAGFTPCGGYKLTKKLPYECCSSEETNFTYACQPGFDLIGDVCQAFREAEFTCLQPGYKKHHVRDECSRAEYVEPSFTALPCAAGDCGLVVNSGHLKKN